MIRLRPSKFLLRGGEARLFALLGALAATAACTAEPAHDLDAVPFVEAVRTIHTGSFDEGETAFATVIGLARTSDGVLHLLQGQAPAVTRIAADGSILDSTGEWGLGPGEYQSPIAIGARGDSVWIVDRGTGRETVYFDGDFVRTARMEAGGVGFRYFTPLPDGGTLGRLVDTGHDGRESGAFSRVDHLVRVDGDGNVADTLAVLTTESTTTVRIFRAEGGAVMTVGPSDFPHDQVDERNGDLWIVERPFPRRSEARVRLVRISPLGDTLAVVRLRKQALPIPDSETAARLSERRAQLLPRLPWDEVEPYVPRPAYRAPTSDFVVGADGWMWLALEARPEATDRVWVMLDPDGAPRYRTRLPAGFAGHAADRRSIVGVYRDALDVPAVETYRVEG
ncbi:MAG: hypothetical protein RLN75_06760 [Longimicrobiales bacterium]